jgi:hypothetical protein
MITKAKFETTRGNLQKMLKWISAPLDDQYDKAWLNIQDEELHAVASMGQAVVSYCTFSQPFVQDIDIHDDVDASAGIESMINLEDLKDYVDFVGGERVEVSFLGNEGEQLCRKMEIDGDIHVDLYVPSSEADYESQQTGIVNLYDDENRWHKPSDDKPLSTRFRTKVREFERIVKVTQFDDFALSTYPVVIEDGEFLLDAKDENERNSIQGSLDAQDVEGPDVNNSYSRGFEELFNNISGEVWVDIEQDTPINVVRESNDNSLVLRYLLLPTQ